MRFNRKLLWLLLLPVAILIWVSVALLFGRKDIEADAVEVVWTFPIDGYTNSHMQDFRPDAGLLLGGGGRITRLATNGSLLLQVDDPSREQAGQLLFGNDERIFGCTHAGEVFGTDAAGALSWTLQLPGMFGPMNSLQQNECQGAMIALRSDGTLLAVSGSGDVGVLSPEGKVLQSFHAPYHFYHHHPVLLVTDAVFAIADQDRMVYLYRTDGRAVAQFSCSTYFVEFAARKDAVLLLARSKSVITAIDSEGRELWRSDSCLPAYGSANYDYIDSISVLPDNRAVVTSGHHVTLLSAEGRRIWQTKLPGAIHGCTLNENQWIDCFVAEENTFLEFKEMLDYRFAWHPKEYIFRLDLAGEVLRCWELPLGSSINGGPGPDGEYYLCQSDISPDLDPMARQTVEVERIVLP